MVYAIVISVAVNNSGGEQMNADQNGNKIGEKKVKKSIVSRAVRQNRVTRKSTSHCNECGFRVRGAGHFDGLHHKAAGAGK